MIRLRVAIGVALLILGLLNLHALVVGLRSHARLRDRTAEDAARELTAVRGLIAPELAPGTAEARDRGLELAGRLSGAVADVLTLDGRPLRPLSGPPVERWLSPSELAAVDEGRAVSHVWFGGPAAVLTYAAFRSGDETVVVRLARSVPDVAEDVRERQEVLLNHGTGLTVLLVLAVLLLLPSSVPGAVDAAPRALLAYEEAMERLRDRGEEMSLQHEAERQRMEGHLRDREALARAGELTTGIVHEVRNGLGTIVAYARLLETSPAGAVAEHARDIRRECETLETVVRRFLDFVRRETLNVAPLDLGRMLERVVTRESRGRTASLAPSPGPAGTIRGDEEMLERAFENVVRNALDAAGPGGHVWIDAAPARDHVVVSVSDDGPGLSSQARQALRPFFTTKPGGLGLGLAMTLKIVKLHGGELTLGDRSPRGLVVRIRLPTGGPV